MSFTIKDGPGNIPVEQLRSEFERAVNDTALLKANTPLGVMEINGAFSHYMNADTDTLWIGYALSRRAGQRIDGHTR